MIGAIRCAALALAVGFSTLSAAQYPERPGRLISPFPPGGLADIFARTIAQSVAEQSGKVFVVENRIGAGGRIGYEAGAKSAPDGYTFVITDVTYTMMPALYGSLPWNHADLVPVTLVAQMPFVVAVNVNAKAASLSDLIGRAKASPNTVNYGSAGVGSVNHVPAHAGRNGLMAGLLAAKGFTSTDYMLEGRNGFADVFGAPANVAALTDGLGEHYECMAVAAKPYPAGCFIHPSIEACLDLAKSSPRQNPDWTRAKSEMDELTLPPFNR